MSSRINEKKMKREYKKAVEKMVTSDIKMISDKLRKRCNMYRLISIGEFMVISGLIVGIYAISI